MTSHPAPFPPAILDVIDRLLADRRDGPILDPWAGVGRIHKVRGRTVGSELQWKWARQRPGRPMVVANTLSLPFRSGSCAAAATSPSYGNRFADSHVPRDLCKTCRGAGSVDGRVCQQCRGGKLSRRRSYTHDHGSPLHPDNSGLHQWGPSYRRLHLRMLPEVARCLAPGAPFVLNISNHYRDRVEQDVTGWWVRHALPSIGYQPGEWRRVATRRMRQGTNADLRPLYEHVIRFEDHRAA